MVKKPRKIGRIPQVAVVLVISIASLMGCYKAPEPPASLLIPNEIPDIRIEVEEQTVEHWEAPIQWNGARFKRQDIFTLPSDFQPVSAMVGDEITIDFGNYPPESVVVELKTVTGEGDNATESNAEEVLLYPLHEATYGIAVNRAGPAEHQIFLYRMQVRWQQNYCEYAFAVQVSQLDDL